MRIFFICNSKFNENYYLLALRDKRKCHILFTLSIPSRESNIKIY